jgi:hypothetical protein
MGIRIPWLWETQNNQAINDKKKNPPKDKPFAGPLGPYEICCPQIEIVPSSSTHLVSLCWTHKKTGPHFTPGINTQANKVKK